MKKFALILLLLGFLKPCFGKCGSGVTVFPKSESIDQNGHIIIEAYGWTKAHELLDLLHVKYPIYLNSISGRINLIRKKYTRGDKLWSQVLLIPEKKLERDQIYTLVLEGLMPEDQSALNLNKRLRNGKLERKSWKVIHESINFKEIKNNELKIKTSHITEYGCGPSVETTFIVTPNYPNGTIFLTQILENETKNVSEYYLILRNNELVIGHGMCSGAFKFKKNNHYKIRFSTNYLKKFDDNIKWITCPNPWINKMH